MRQQCDKAQLLSKDRLNVVSVQPVDCEIQKELTCHLLIKVYQPHTSLSSDCSNGDAQPEALPGASFALQVLVQVGDRWIGDKMPFHRVHYRTGGL